MNILIRADASVQIGSGHIMRCLTLADELKKQGAEVFFICREFEGHLCGLIESMGYRVFKIPGENAFDAIQDAEQVLLICKREKLAADWLIVDHYGLDEQWERLFKPFVKKIAVIDDLANRVHDCDLLLDQNLYKNMELRYNALVPSSCRKLLGPAYALLRPEFKQARKNSNKRNGYVRRMLIFFGSSDPTNETVKALQAIKQMPLANIEVDVVVGAVNPNKAQVHLLCNEMKNVTYHCQIDYMADLMNHADVAIGAGGATTWERAYLGLPAITISVAENQLEISETMAKAGAVIHLGWYGNVAVEALCEVIQTVIENPPKLKAMGDTAYQIMNSSTGEPFVTLFDILMEGNNHANE